MELDNATSTDYCAVRCVEDHKEESHLHRVPGGYQATSKARLHFAHRSEGLYWFRLELQSK